MQLLGLEGYRILQGFHQGGVFGDVVVLMANPLRDPHGAICAAADNHPNARRPGISQATAVNIGYEFRHGCDVRFCLQDALIPVLRQDDYLIPFHRFAVDPTLVHFYVQKEDEFPVPFAKVLPYSHLPFELSTALPRALAPKVCVDDFFFSVKVVCVDGRKGWHNNTEPVRSRLSDQPGGATCKATRPEKTDSSARSSWGLELRKQ
jgi:hypothetical protein